MASSLDLIVEMGMLSMFATPSPAAASSIEGQEKAVPCGDSEQPQMQTIT